VTSRCVTEPVSWLRLERFHLGEVDSAEHDRIAQHLSLCPACAACLTRIEHDATRELPPLPIRERPRRRGLPAWGLAGAGALAAAAAVVIGLGPFVHPGARAPATVVGDRIKGGEVAFSLVREDDERFAGTAGVFRNGDRFKAVVSCPPGMAAAFDLAVYDSSGVSFPLETARGIVCGNDVPLPGAFRVTGGEEETVCLVWGEDGLPNRAALAMGADAAMAAGGRLCKRLEPATSP
jgi:hypothetical protein